MFCKPSRLWIPMFHNNEMVIVQQETTLTCCWTWDRNVSPKNYNAGLLLLIRDFGIRILPLLSLTGLETTTSYVPVGGGGFVNLLGTLAGNQPLFRAPVAAKGGHHCSLFSLIWTIVEKFSGFGHLSSHPG